MPMDSGYHFLIPREREREREREKERKSARARLSSEGEFS